MHKSGLSKWQGLPPVHVTRHRLRMRIGHVLLSSECQFRTPYVSQAALARTSHPRLTNITSGMAQRAAAQPNTRRSTAALALPSAAEIRQLSTESLRLLLDRLNLITTGKRQQLVARLTCAAITERHTEDRAGTSGLSEFHTSGQSESHTSSQSASHTLRRSRTDADRGDPPPDDPPAGDNSDSDGSADATEGEFSVQSPETDSELLLHAESDGAIDAPPTTKRSKFHNPSQQLNSPVHKGDRQRGSPRRKGRGNHQHDRRHGASRAKGHQRGSARGKGRQRAPSHSPCGDRQRGSTRGKGRQHAPSRSPSGDCRRSYPRGKGRKRAPPDSPSDDRQSDSSRDSRRHSSTSSEESSTSSSSPSSTSSSSRSRSHHRRRKGHRSRHHRHRSNRHRKRHLGLVSCVPPLPSHLRRKIARGEYVDFDKLLPPPHMPPIGTASLPKKRHSDPYRRVHDGPTWQEAWNQYLGTRVTHDPSLALPLIKYQAIMSMLFAHYAPLACLEYDRLFRQHAARNPAPGWDHLKEEIFVWALTRPSQPTHVPALPQSQPQSSHQAARETGHVQRPTVAAHLAPSPPTATPPVNRPPEPHASHDPAGTELCKRFNIGRCTREDCIYQHSCWRPGCNGSHPGVGCPNRPT